MAKFTKTRDTSIQDARYSVKSGRGIDFVAYHSNCEKHEEYASVGIKAKHPAGFYGIDVHVVRGVDENLQVEVSDLKGLEELARFSPAKIEVIKNIPETINGRRMKQIILEGIRLAKSSS